MSRFKLTVHLKQHTPIIHFQHDQVGATLRATEVKPKLDRWIKKHHNGPIPKAWKVGKSEALNYKLKLLPEGPALPPQDTGHSTPMYFADMGDSANDKKQLFNEHRIRLDLFVPDAELRALIHQQLGAFFFHHNFGTRQNKGYGAFALLNEQNEPVTVPNHFRFSFHFNRSNEQLNDRFTELFTVIQFYYQRLKSGINYKKGTLYHPPFLREYVRDTKGYHWEKRWVKEHLTDIPVTNDPDRTEYFARALLGLPYEFRYMNRRQAGARAHGPLPSRRTNIKITPDGHEIKRIKSPLTFKPIISGNRATVYVLIDAFGNAPVGIPFRFDNGRKNRRLSTPPKMIDLTDLLRRYHQHLGRTFNACDFRGNSETNVTIEQ